MWRSVVRRAGRGVRREAGGARVTAQRCVGCGLWACRGLGLGAGCRALCRARGGHRQTASQVLRTVHVGRHFFTWASSFALRAAGHGTWLVLCYGFYVTHHCSQLVFFRTTSILLV